MGQEATDRRIVANTVAGVGMTGTKSGTRDASISIVRPNTGKRRGASFRRLPGMSTTIRLFL